jgi:4-hydroxybenzoyl-CoA reductase subunit beta
LPQSLQELITLLDNYPEATLLAGGTDLMPRIKNRAVYTEQLICTQNIKELNFLKHENGVIRIGSNVTLDAITASPIIKEYAPGLAQAARRVASAEIRNIATIAGNLCQDTRCWHYNRPHGYGAAPRKPCYKAGGKQCYVTNKTEQCFSIYRGNLAPVLIALNAKLKIVSKQGKYDLPVAGLFSGDAVRPVSLKPNEIITEVILPVTGQGLSSFLAFSHRQAVDFPLICVGTFLSYGSSLADHSLDFTEQQKNIKIALSGVDSRPIRLGSVENALLDKELNTEAIKKATRVISEKTKFAINVAWGHPQYLREILNVLVERCLTNSYYQLIN